MYCINPKWEHTSYLNKVEALRLVLLSRGQGAELLVNVGHPPHSEAQQGRVGAHTRPQHVQQLTHV